MKADSKVGLKAEKMDGMMVEMKVEMKGVKMVGKRVEMLASE
jgi:hypothetical protein